MNQYEIMRKRHHDEYAEFPLHFAFGDEQLKRKFAELGLDPEKDLDKITIIPGTGGFFLKQYEPAFNEMNERQSRELREAIAADATGDGFIFEMFRSELSNCEFGYDEEMAVEGMLSAVGLTLEEIHGDPRLNHGYEKAKEDLRKDW